MNGIEKITARIEQDTGAEIEVMEREAQAKAQEIRRDYEAQAAAASAKAAEEGRQAAQRRQQLLESAAQMEARSMLLAAKQDCLDEAFDKALQKLLGLPENAYADLLARIAAKAAKTGREEIVLNERDRVRFGSQVAAKANALLAQAAAPDLAGELKGSKAGKILSKVVTGASALLQGTALLTLAADTAEIEGGLILRDGNVEVNCAFETQLRILRESMASEVAAALFA